MTRCRPALGPPSTTAVPKHALQIDARLWRWCRVEHRPRRAAVAAARCVARLAAPRQSARLGRPCPAGCCQVCRPCRLPVGQQQQRDQQRVCVQGVRGGQAVGARSLGPRRHHHQRSGPPSGRARYWRARASARFRRFSLTSMVWCLSHAAEGLLADVFPDAFAQFARVGREIQSRCFRTLPKLEWRI